MLQVLIVAGVALVALGVGWYMQQQQPDAPPPTSHTVPDQLDRNDFTRPDAPWLVTVFTSETCATCAKVWQAAELVDSDDVAVQNIEVSADAALHERYAITAVPLVAVVDAAGVTRRSFLGPPTAADLWAALAELRGDD
ncbi:MAG: hypothetical protein HKN94_03115 [Acidimicrobiales bacterium]|nr:hypothetical protein [Acidimicrobiales bacterium]